MNAMYIMLAIGFGYWIGNAKSPQVVYDQSKCPTILQLKVDDLQGPSKPTQPTIVEPINQSTQQPAPSTKNENVEQVFMENGHLVVWSGTSDEYEVMLRRRREAEETRARVRDEINAEEETKQ